MTVDLTEKFEEALNNAQLAGVHSTEIQSRTCTSDNYDGTEYEFRGECVPVRPLLDIVETEELLRVETITFVDEWDDARLIMFVAEIPERDGEVFV